MNDKSGAQKYMEAEKAIIQKNFKILELKDEIVKLRTENEGLKEKIRVAEKLMEGTKIAAELLRTENAALKEKVRYAEYQWECNAVNLSDTTNSLTRQKILTAESLDKAKELKARWEELIVFKDKEEVEYNGADTGFMNGQAVMWNKFKNKIGELESGGESPSMLPMAKPEDTKLVKGQPKPDSLSICKSCGCMTKTVHDEEIQERCGKCGKVKAVRG